MAKVKSCAFEIKARFEIGFSIARFYLSFTANERESWGGGQFALEFIMAG